jgi:large subunit ribosomal protein L21
MYAVIECKGKQYLVQEGERLVIDRSEEKANKTFNPPVLLARGKDKIYLGKPTLKEASVTAQVVSHNKGKKVVAFKYRRRKGYERAVGFRPLQTLIQINQIKISEK